LQLKGNVTVLRLIPTQRNKGWNIEHDSKYKILVHAFKFLEKIIEYVKQTLQHWIREVIANEEVKCVITIAQRMECMTWRLSHLKGFFLKVANATSRWATVFCKDWILNILGFTGCAISVRTP
jgi:hypothetical protein